MAAAPPPSCSIFESSIGAFWCRRLPQVPSSRLSTLEISSEMTISLRRDVPEYFGKKGAIFLSVLNSSYRLPEISLGLKKDLY